MKNKRFNKLVKEYFDLFIKRYPEYGSFLGLHEYDGKLSNQSREKYLEDIKFYKAYLDKFKKTNLKELTDQERLDRRIIIHQLNLSIFAYENLKLWESDPDVLEEIGSTLFLLLIRPSSSFYNRIKSINNALKDLPKILEQTRPRFTKPYKLWTEIAIESCEAMELFLKELRAINIKKSLKKELNQNVNFALIAVEDYKNFLRKKLLPNSIDKYSLGGKKFKQLIKLRELGLGINKILKIGENILERDRQRLKEISQKIDPTLTLEEIKEKIRNNYPQDFNQVVREYKKSICETRKFIIDNRLMKIPNNEKVVIKETPSFLRHTTPFAAYFPPAKFDKNKIGIYIVTPPEQTGLLKKHNYHAIYNTSVHEAYPGHHLQFVCGYRNSSLIRTLGEATEFVEGWAHYCEEFMRSAGYNNNHEAEFIQILDEIWRATRVIIDIKLHTGKMTFEKAVRFLTEQSGMEKEDAVAEVKRYTKSPSYQLSYLIGKELIKKLKNDVRKGMREKYSDRFFHENILNAGVIPIKYLREEFALKIRKI